ADRVFDHGTEKVATATLRVFVTHLEAWASEINELVLLENTEDSPLRTLRRLCDATCSVISQLAAKYNTTHVWYVSPHCNEMYERVLAESPVARLTVTGPTGLFERILPLPAAFTQTVVSDV